MKKTIPLSIIAKVVANYYVCEQEELFIKTRKKEIILRRQWFQYLARILNPERIISNVMIGEYLSYETKIKYDNATVINNVKRVSGYISSYNFERELELYFIKEIKTLNKSYVRPEINKGRTVNNICPRMVLEWNFKTTN